MTEQKTDLAGQIRTLVVNDYFTPNIKAEVILDTLLTPYIEQLVQAQLKTGKLTFLTKEMSIEEVSIEEGGTDDRGAKIDYVLEDEANLVYLVELKTTQGSINNEQIARYIKNCHDRQFGSAIWEKLLRILKRRFPEEDISNPEGVFWRSAGGRGNYAKWAMDYLKRTGRASTYKYLYTMGQILDRSPDISKLWRKDLWLVYLTPDGGDVFPGRPRRKDAQEQARAMREWEDFKTKWDEFSSGISLKKSVGILRDTGGEYALLLANIIDEIYGVNRNG